MSASKAEVISIISVHNCPIDPDRPVFVKCREYDVIFVRYWKGYLYGGVPKLILVFKILSVGTYFGLHLNSCYNIKGFTKRKEIITKGWHSSYVREYSHLFGKPMKLRDIILKPFKGKVFRCSVRTVKKDFKQRPLPKDLYYSVIDQLLEVKAG
jgi:hypothetical protein